VVVVVSVLAAIEEVVAAYKKSPDFIHLVA
jgi:hypothetical protein